MPENDLLHSSNPFLIIDLPPLAWTALSQMYVQDGQIGEAEDAKANARILSLGGKIVKDS